jgi:hypothetical protein
MASELGALQVAVVIAFDRRVRHGVAAADQRVERDPAAAVKSPRPMKVAAVR